MIGQQERQRLNPALEGLRGMGAIMVLIHHYVYQLSTYWSEALAGLHALHAGVDLFFVLTGYLFAPLLLGERQDTLVRFGLRRIFRLYPLYLLSLLVAWWLVGFTDPVALKQWLLHLVFLQVAPGQSLADISYFSEIYWTLSAEVAFYLFVTLWLCTGAWGTPRVRLVLLGIISATGFLLFYYIGHAPTDGRWVIRQAQLPALLLEFWWGMVVYHLMQHATPCRLRAFALLLLAFVVMAGLYVIYPGAVETAITPRPFGYFNILAALGFALLLWSVLEWQAVIPAGENPPWWHRPALFLGALSYGIYLFHDLIMDIVGRLPMSPGEQVLASIVITWLVATILYRLVEAPCRNIGRRIARQQ